MNKLPLILGMLASTVLAGCQVEKQAYDHSKATHGLAEQGLAASASPLPAADVSPVKVRNDVYVGSKAIRNEHGDPLPAKFERTNGITIVRTSPTSLKELASIITSETKVPVVVAAVANAGATVAAAGGAAPPAGATGLQSAPGPVPEGFPLNQALAALGNGGGMPAGGAGGSSQGSVISAPNLAPVGSLALNYTGKLSGLLDMLSAHFNVAWRHEGGRIVLDTVVTRSFDVPALPIIANLSFDLTTKSETSGGEGSASSGQAANTKSATDVWKDMQTAIAALAGGTATSINTTTGVVTVTADPATVNRVGEYIKGMNQRLSQQIAISVKVYSVSLKDDQDFDLNVAGIFRQAGKYGINVGNAAASGVVPAIGGASGLATGGLGWALLDTTSKWSGSNALVNALQTRGDVSVVTTASVTTVNGVPVPLQVGTLRDYVKSIKVTTNNSGSNGGTETQIEPGSVTTGFNLHLVPRVDRTGDLMLQYGINISELTGSNDGFDTFTSGGQTVQLRRVNQRNFIQQAKIPNGNTLVLAGFEQVKSTSDKQGVGHYNFPLLGGKRGASMQREIIVIAITPTLLDLSKQN